VLEVVFTEPVEVAAEADVRGEEVAANPTSALIAALRQEDPLVQVSAKGVFPGLGVTGGAVRGLGMGLRRKGSLLVQVSA
jgi:hypothetical protein